MKVCGTASATHSPPMRTSATRANSLDFRREPECRPASSATTSAPTLWTGTLEPDPGIAEADDQEGGGFTALLLAGPSGPPDHVRARNLFGV
jgi:hypothetical protein